MLRGLSQYRLLRALARGGQAHVYLAMDMRLQRRVCIKVYHLQNDRALRRRLEQEAWKLARVQSPRVVQVYDVVGHGAELALVLNHVPGCNLEQLLDEEQQLPPEEAIAIVSDLAVALAALRSAGLMHGDLSPRNVLLDSDGRATLGDFGVAVMRGESLLGFSVDSLAPEQLRGTRGDLRSDFFSLGLLLHRSLTGAHPFEGEGGLDRAALMKGLVREPDLQPMPAAAASAVQELLAELLAADPGGRPRGTFELRERLREIRALLPRPEGLGNRVARAAHEQTGIDEPLRLPPRLVRLPLSHRLIEILRHRWRRSEPALRAVLLGFVALPVLSAVAWYKSPETCIAVAEPSLRNEGIRIENLPGSFALRDRLTSMVKAAAPRALVLGSGVDSDSQPVLGAYGLRDRCVAQRQLALAVDCVAGRCLLEMRSRGPDAAHREQMTLPMNEGLQSVDQALKQLLRAQQAVLLR